jgi:hypothetical protein
MLARITLPFLLLAFCLLVLSALCPHQEFVTSAAIAIQDTGQSDSQLAKRVDLSGTYFGTLQYSDRDLSGVARLTISGNSFVLEIDATKLSGHIEAVEASDHIKVSLTFTPQEASPGESISLSARKTGGYLWLSSPPGESHAFRFAPNTQSLEIASTSKARTRALKRRPASIFADSDSYSTVTNATTSPTSSDRVTNTNTSTTNANTGGIYRTRILPNDGNSSAPHSTWKVPGGAKRSSPKRDESLPTNINSSAARSQPNANVRATGGIDFPQATTASPSGNPSTSTNSSGLSQIRGNANLAFTTPERMKLQEIVDIELVVDPSKSSDELIKALNEPGRAGTGSTEFADRMEATLVSSGFDIIAACPPIQLVEAGHTTRWKWQIKAKEGGSQRLDLTLNAVLNDGKDRSLVQTFHRDIHIDVTWKERAAGMVSTLKDVQWLWAFIVVPIAGGVYGWWRRKQQQASNVAS